MTIRIEEINELLQGAEQVGFTPTGGKTGSIYDKTVYQKGDVRITVSSDTSGQTVGVAFGDNASKEGFKGTRDGFVRFVGDGYMSSSYWPEKEGAGPITRTGKLAERRIRRMMAKAH